MQIASWWGVFSFAGLLVAVTMFAWQQSTGRPLVLPLPGQGRFLSVDAGCITLLTQVATVREAPFNGAVAYPIYGHSTPDVSHYQKLCDARGQTNLSWSGGRVWLPRWSQSGPIVLGGDTVVREDARKNGFLAQTLVTFQLTQIYFPLWIPAAACGALSVIAARRWQRNRRQRTAGLCRSCGYDLRYSPQRCPECGADVSVA